MSRTLFILFFSFCIQTAVFSQFGKEIDSLIALSETAKDKEQVDLLNKICWKLRNSNPHDALNFSLKSIQYSKKIGYEKGEIMAYSFTGVLYKNLGNYSDAFDYYLTGLELSQKYGDLEQEGYGHNNLGNLFIYQEQPEKARFHLERAQAIAEQLDNKKMIAYSSLYLGRVFIMLNDYDNAEINILKSLQKRRELNDKEGEAVCYKYLGDIRLGQNELDSALMYYFKSEDIIEITNDIDLFADAANNIAKTYILKDSLAKAQRYALQSLELTQQIGSKLRVKNAYKTLSEIAYLNKDYQRTIEYMQKIVLYKDSLFNDDVSKIIASIEFSSAQKEKEAVRELELKQQKTLNTTLTIILTLAMGMGVVLLISNNRRKKANQQLAAQTVEIQEKNGELYQINEELATQRDYLEKLYSQLEGKNHELSYKQRQITDSIQYANRIQQAVMPPEKILQRYFSQYFVYLAPRDIVSGDFYWLTKKVQTVFVAVADCTGHGVPGAFMSILSISFLNEIIIRNLKNIYRQELTPSFILNQLRDMIKKALQQDENATAGGIKDGLDIALCAIDMENNILQFSGAHNPLYIINTQKINSERIDKIATREKPKPIATDYKILDLENCQNTLLEVKADRMPVAVYLKEKPFSIFETPIYEGDRLYMFSDGYSDQTGGEEGRKFFTKNFKQLLLETSSVTMNEQENKLSETITLWRGDRPQVDDILVVGIKI